jgi:uncharacterized protein (DUF1499 family)
MRIIIWLISIAAILLALAIALAGPGTRFGLWEYGTGLTIIRQAAMPTMIAAGASVTAFAAALIGARSLTLLPLIAALGAGAAAMVPVKMKQAVDAYPLIHDITTDFENPPPIVAGANAERKNPPGYVGAEQAPRLEITIAEAQRDAFPDIQPITVDKPVEETADIARDVVTSMGMALLSDGPVEEGWLIEATATTLWFGFIDDFVVRVTPDGDGARVDVRSKSRVGLSDLGANGLRVLEFSEKFSEAAA